MNPPSLTRILLVDDHFMVRLGLSAVLSREPDLEVVGQAANGKEALELFDRLRPDVVLMDGVLPDMHGFEVVRLLLSRHPYARVLMLSVNDTEEDIHQAVEAGARGYMPKSSEEDETILAIRRVAAGHEFLPPEVARKLAVRKLHSALSERELAVLRLAAEGRTNKEIAAALGLGGASVKTYLARIFTKLGATDRTQAVSIARDRGILRR
ncbi:MAG: DNA-binding response regulator [Verrucomicrobia bacterium]|nr:MAG: DNA-binding response regulator [Verrucomicrobiota bacterium]TAE88563.1 MAG: DNA-binding response regulator [Verrucomicrobiota bacterium]TAF27018.1 MAG: DNA-binding response regulator [Verrucomicrobiota bacterium]TAF42274.1 MAG: DNA-binding response regulator [Verrucomicrobiota bacterium]